MSNKKMEKIYLAVQDIRTLAARARPDCADTRECNGCPAIIALPGRLGIACLFEVIRREGNAVKESVRTIFCCVCRRPMILIRSGSGKQNLWQCTTSGCVIHEHAESEKQPLSH